MPALRILPEILTISVTKDKTTAKAGEEVRQKERRKENVTKMELPDMQETRNTKRNALPRMLVRYTG